MSRNRMWSRGWRGVLAGLIGAAWLVIAGRADAEPIKLVQPFQMRLERYDAQVIAFLSEHPTYDAVEAFYQERPGQPPLIRAIVTLRDGFQIDHINDPLELAERRSPFRPAVLRDIDFRQEALPGGRVRATARFESYRGEDIVIDIVTIGPPEPPEESLLDPGTHAATSALPVLWLEAGVPGTTESAVLIDGVPQAMTPGPIPGTVFGFYSNAFDVGEILADVDRLTLVEGPEEIRVGAAWVFVDSMGLVHRYEVIAVQGADIVLRRTTGQEQILVTRRRAGRPDLLEIRSIRVTGVRAALNITPPPPAGLTLDLTTPGRFSLSLDEHVDLITGTAEASYGLHRVSWTLRPTQPSWAVSREVNATGWFDRSGDVFLLTTIGETERPEGPCP